MSAIPPNRVFGFTARSDRLMRVLLSRVEISQAFDPENDQRPPHKEFFAIWDTGATNSVISEKVVNECGLKPIGIVKVMHAGGENYCDSFLINIVLPNNVGLSNIRVTQGSLTAGADVLVGMDVITKGDFAVSNYHGKTCMSFRIPSVSEIDLKSFDKVEKPPDPAKKMPKIGRNAPCPCGSGKKYKRCHGK